MTKFEGVLPRWHYLRNFGNFLRVQKLIINYFVKFWAYFGKNEAIGQIFIIVNGQILKKQTSHLATLFFLLRAIHLLTREEFSDSIFRIVTSNDWPRGQSPSRSRRSVQTTSTLLPRNKNCKFFSLSNKRRIILFRRQFFSFIRSFVEWILSNFDKIDGHQQCDQNEIAKFL